jgi:predicted ArsR family transcriptional regulator
MLKEEIVLLLSKTPVPVTASYIARNLGVHFYQVIKALDDLTHKGKVVALRNGNSIYFTNH